MASERARDDELDHVVQGLITTIYARIDAQPGGERICALELDALLTDEIGRYAQEREAAAREVIQAARDVIADHETSLSVCWDAPYAWPYGKRVEWDSLRRLAAAVAALPGVAENLSLKESDMGIPTPMHKPSLPSPVEGPGAPPVTDEGRQAVATAKALSAEAAVAGQAGMRAPSRKTMLEEKDEEIARLKRLLAAANGRVTVLEALVETQKAGIKKPGIKAKPAAKAKKKRQ